MDQQTNSMLRHISQNHIDLHPYHSSDTRNMLARLFDLDDEHLDALHELAMWIANHNLEYAIEQRSARFRR